MEINQYQKEVLRTASTNETEKEMQIFKWALGLAGETGDTIGCIKKTIFHKNNQIDGIKENIGDTMWYLAMICNHYEFKFHAILEGNIEKLRKRYPKGFTFKDAQRECTRKDWMEEKD